MSTPNLTLEQPAYLSDGETAVGQVNANFTIIDQLIDNVVCAAGAIVIADGSIVTAYS